MPTKVYALDIPGKILSPLQPVTMSTAGLTEPRDLEAWLASAGDDVFGRKVVWIARQDRPSDDQRSDLIGIDNKGDLIVAELKRGEVDVGAVTQGLSYAAEYRGCDAERLAEMFARHSSKDGSSVLVDKVASEEDATAKLASLVGDDADLNESQVVVLVGESFSASALSVCDYLNSASGEAQFSLECWKYGVFGQGEREPVLVIEQILPPPSVRQEIEERREASKARKKTRDPVRVAFMNALMRDLRDEHADEVTAGRSRGQSYECELRLEEWREGAVVWLRASADHSVQMYVDVAKFGPVGDVRNVTKATETEDGVEYQVLGFEGLDLAQEEGGAFVSRLLDLMRELKEVERSSDSEIAGPG